MIQEFIELYDTLAAIEGHVQCPNTIREHIRRELNKYQRKRQLADHLVAKQSVEKYGSFFTGVSLEVLTAYENPTKSKEIG